MAAIDDAKISENTLADFWFGLRRKVFEQIGRQFKASGLNQRQLANRLGKSEARVSKWLHGRENITLRTMSDMARAMDCRLEVAVKPLSEVDAIPNYRYDELATHSNSRQNIPPSISATGSAAPLFSEATIRAASGVISTPVIQNG
jgi:transcriptional regulator with XRE-family HTH domain